MHTSRESQGQNIFLKHWGVGGGKRKESNPICSKLLSEDVSSKGIFSSRPPPPQGKSRGPSSQIHGADKSVSESDTSRWRKEKKKKGEEDKLPGFFSLQEKKRFPLADEGKAPLTFFFSLCTVAAARLGGARSAAFLLPLPATNEASQPRSGQTFSLSGSSPRGAGEWSPRPPSRRCSARPAPGWEKPGCPQRTTFWFPL